MGARDESSNAIGTKRGTSIQGGPDNSTSGLSPSYNPLGRTEIQTLDRTTTYFNFKWQEGQLTWGFRAKSEQVGRDQTGPGADHNPAEDSCLGARCPGQLLTSWRGLRIKRSWKHWWLPQDLKTQYRPRWDLWPSPYFPGKIPQIFCFTWKTMKETICLWFVDHLFFLQNGLVQFIIFYLNVNTIMEQ